MLKRREACGTVSFSPGISRNSAVTRVHRSCSAGTSKPANFAPYSENCDISLTPDDRTASYRHQSFQREYRLRRHDGIYRWIVDTGVARRNLGGSFIGYVGSAIDVTEREIAERALAANAAELQSTLNERRAREQLSKVLHENLRQLLLAVKLQCDRLLWHSASKPTRSTRARGPNQERSTDHDNRKALLDDG